MRVGGGWKWGALVLAAAMVFSLGCAKKEAVKSADTKTPGAPGAGSAPAGGIVSEAVKPEAKAPEAEKRIAASEAAAGVAATQEMASMFQDIRFDFDKSAIRADAKPVLAKVADYLKKNGNAKLQIEGHCDDRGTAEYNMALGDRRADSARKYLVSLGVKAAAVSTISFGKEKPLDPGHNEEAWAKNRRAHFVLK